jgi:endonuclease/exonuclease/phosphatase (EEP) superfamily protein YafD
MPFPVLSIDHLWVGRGLRVARCRLEGSAASDHRAVVAEIGF